MNTSSRVQSTPVVSVVVRCYNRLNRVLVAIDSILAQTYQDFEIVVVDDASTDGSVQQIREHYARFSHVRLLCHAQNKGAAAAANTGVEAATGHYVAFLDSDDSWLPEFLAAHVQAIASERGKLLSYCDYVQVFEGYDLQRLAACGHSQDQRRDFLLGGFIHSQSMTLALRKALLDAGGFDEQYVISHDFDLWLRIALQNENPFVHIAQPLVRYSLASDGVTTYSERWLQEYHAVINKGFEHPGAAPYRELRAQALADVALGIVGRRQLMRWVEQPAPLSVSVIIRTSGRRALLERALQSVLIQSVQPSEIIVVDNASDDDTAQMLSTFDDDRLKVVSLRHAVNTAAALNAGAFKASGDLLAFLDDDDEWLPNYLQHQVRANSLVHKTAVYTYTDYNLCLDSQPPQPRQHKLAGDTSDVIEHALFNVLPHTMSAMVIRREWFMAIGGVDEALHLVDDVSLQLRLLCLEIQAGQPAAHTNPPAHVPKALLNWHRGPSGDYREKMLDDYLRQCEHAYREFFASTHGQAYRSMRDAVEAQLKSQIKMAFEQHFSITRGD